MRWIGLRTHRLVVSFHASLILLATCHALPFRAEAETLRFVSVARGIGHAAFEVHPPEGEPFSGHAFKIDLSEAQLRLVTASDPSSRQPVDQIAASIPAVVAINASFFDKDGRAMGLAVGESGRLGTGKLRNWGALVVNGTDARIVLGAGIPSNPDDPLIVQGIPRLVVAGKVPGLKPQLAERTAVCAASGRVVMLSYSVRNSEVPSVLPHLSKAIATWDGRGLPPDQVFSALALDLRSNNDSMISEASQGSMTVSPGIARIKAESSIA